MWTKKERKINLRVSEQNLDHKKNWDPLTKTNKETLNFKWGSKVSSFIILVLFSLSFLGNTLECDCSYSWKYNINWNYTFLFPSDFSMPSKHWDTAVPSFFPWDNITTEQNFVNNLNKSWHCPLKGGCISMTAAEASPCVLLSRFNIHFKLRVCLSWDVKEDQSTSIRGPELKVKVTSGALIFRERGKKKNKRRLQFKVCFQMSVWASWLAVCGVELSGGKQLSGTAAITKHPNLRAKRPATEKQLR